MGTIMILSTIMTAKISHETDLGKGSVHSTIKHKEVPASCLEDEVVGYHIW